MKFTPLQIAHIMEAPVGTVDTNDKTVLDEQDWITNRYLELRRKMRFDLATRQARADWVQQRLQNEQ